MGYVTTHVLDTARGVPAAGLSIKLYRLQVDEDGFASRCELTSVTTNADGRCDNPVLLEEDFALGDYELVFYAGDYLLAHDLPTDFLSDITIRFLLSKNEHYHIPLLLSPYAYSTYRGS